ncbi:MAG: L-lactate permease [Opitutales bacterium]|nr:L-lactate permease [Opitutales bacterium]
MNIFPFLTACLPILWLILALGVFKMAAHRACLIALAGTVLLAACRGQNSLEILTASTEGFATALWPIGIVIIAALFCYNLCVETRAMEKIKAQLGTISTDQSVLILLIAWGFGNFMEGMAGFGTAVAIPASMLVALGIKPMRAVLVCLIGNSMPTSFGAVGVSTETLSAVTGLDVLQLSKSLICLQVFQTLLLPFLMLAVGAGRQALKDSWQVTAIAAASFTLPWAATAWFVGPELPNIVGAACTMLAIIAFVKIQKKENPVPADNAFPQKNIACTEICRAWSPFIFVTAFLAIASRLCPVVFSFLRTFSSNLQIYSGDNPNTLTFYWISTPGVLILLATFCGGLCQQASFKTIAMTLSKTVRQYFKTILTICCVMATAKLMSYSGMIGNIAETLVGITGTTFPVISPWIGAVGAFLTGSGTSTGVLFGEVQMRAALSLGLDPFWTVAANLFGAGIGKMICPQSIVIGAGAIGLGGSESAIWRSVIPFFTLYVLLAGTMSAIACWLFA